MKEVDVVSLLRETERGIDHLSTISKSLESIAASLAEMNERQKKMVNANGNLLVVRVKTWMDD